MASIIPHTPIKALSLANTASYRKIIPSPEKSQPSSNVQISPIKKRAASPSSPDIGGPSKRSKRPSNKETPEILIGKSHIKSLDSSVELTTITDADDLSPETDLAETIKTSRKVIYDWSLLDERDRLPRTPSKEEFNQLIKLFPKTMSVAVVGPMLRIVVQDLPAKPWPLTVAGLPLFLTNNDEEYGWYYGDGFGSGAPALTHLDTRRKVTKDHYKTVAQYFDNTAVKISAVAWVCGVWEFMVPKDTAQHSIPRKLGKSLCCYSFEKKEPVFEVARRSKQPSDQIWDSSVYSPVLRPGIVLCSSEFGDVSDANFRESLLTTSGLKVKKDGRFYITVAQHGFPVGEETVYHPRLPLIIGEVKYRLGDTDIALVELSSGVSYTNELFENSEFQARRMTTVRPCDSLQSAEALYMDTPFTGLAEGCYLYTEMKRVPIDEPVEPNRWVFSIYCWIGQNVSQEKEGSCGSVVTDEEGRAVCFYRFITKTGKAIGAAADELATFQCQIVDE